MRIIKRWATIIVGSLVLAAGVMLIPVPGPGGLPVTLAGLAILASEVPWARWLLRRFKQRLQALASERLGTRNRWKRLGMVAGLLVLWLIGGIVAWRVWVF